MFHKADNKPVVLTVLIVAKCIVNIGSRKLSREMNIVLIVAKCIVNFVRKENMDIFELY